VFKRILFSLGVSLKAFWAAKTEASFLLTKPKSGRQNAAMRSQASGLRVASVIFAFFAIGHVVRLVKQAQVTVATHQIPMWVSVVALVIAAILSTWMWRLSSARG
jgi:cytochrome bd-type quinol oxidase subunit 2